MKKRLLVNQLANGQHTVSEIAYRAGVAESTVREYVRRGRKEGKDLKYKYVQTPPWSESDIEELKKLREQGLTYRAIAKQFGTTAPWVYKLINNKRKKYVPRHKTDAQALQS